MPIGFAKKLNQVHWRATLQPSFNDWDIELNRLLVELNRCSR